MRRIPNIQKRNAADRPRRLHRQALRRRALIRRRQRIIPPANPEHAARTALVSARLEEDRLQQYYLRLAEAASDHNSDSTSLEDETERELQILRRSSASLLHAYYHLRSMEDELGARLKDMRTSRTRKWYLPNPPANASIDLAEKKARHFAQGINLYKLFLVCFIGSFVGVVVELIWCLLRNGYLESRSGLIYGPFNLLYGAGAVVMTLALYRYRNRSSWLSFAGGFLAGSIMEYVCSWGQELVLGSTSWDYSMMPFNINGRICLLYSVFWGLLGVLWMKNIYPRMAKWILKIPNKAGKVITWLTVIFMTFNVVMTGISVLRWSDRINNTAQPTPFGIWVDKHFPDERMQRVFANMEFHED